MGLREVRLLRGLRGLTGLMWLLYIYCDMVEQHGNRLYGAMGLLSKKWSGVGEWIEWIPLRLS